jgi:NAD(P)-dependent dehydrogenase (short-subunit alcohol dehydrogenase family)
MMAGRLACTRCLLVGGRGGIGAAAATRTAAEGASVVASGLAPAERAIACDATDPTAIEDLFRRANESLGGLDVLYHVAGGSGRRRGDGSLHECSDDGWQHTLDLNLRSAFLTNRAAVGHFLANKQPGVILNLASVLAFSPSPHFFDTCAYAAAKGGLIAMSRSAAARYAADGIRVNVLAPGLIDTPMAARAVGDPAIAAFLRTKQPLADGPGQPDDLAEVAVFLCSDESRLITGCVLPADGGWSVSDGQYHSIRD